MIKTFTKIVVLVTMIAVLGGGLFAQQSNTSQATFEEFGTNVDDFLSSTAWSGVLGETSKFFAFSRFGARTVPEGKLDVGAAFNAGNLYMGLYYNGAVAGYGENTQTGSWALGTDGTKVNWTLHEKKNPNATYGALLGLPNGMGLKFTFVDELEVTPTTPATPTEAWIGTLTPAIELGGTFGPITKIGLSLPIVYNRIQSIAAAGAAVTYTTTLLDDDGNAVATGGDAMKEASGNYVQPDIYLSFAFGSLTLDTNLRFNIYGAPGYKTDGKAGGLGGVGNVTTVYNVDTDADSRVAIWDKRFWMEGEISPWYNISGETEKLAYSTSFGLPVIIRGVAHALNYKAEGAASVEITDYNKSGEFALEIAPWLNAAVKYQLFDMLSVQGGIGLNIFDWKMNAKSSTKVDAPSNAGEAAIVAANGGASADSSAVEFEFGYPKLSFAAGFTFDFKQKAALDMVFIHYANPSAPGSIYKAVGDGLGSSDTSIVLTINL